MFKYTCEKCGKEFKQKSHYTTHLNRKNPCFVEINKTNPFKLDDNKLVKDINPIKVDIVKPILKWVGGKTQILDKLIAEFPTKINNYHEIFLGGGSVLFTLLSYIRDGLIGDMI